MGNNPLSATTAIVKEGKKNSPAPLTDILKMRMDGLKLREIAEKYGVTQQAISRRITGAFKLLDRDRLDAYRLNRINVLESIEESLLSELLAPERVKKATLGNVAYAFNQIHTARRLESGESTANLSLSALVSSIERRPIPPLPKKTPQNGPNHAE